MTNNFCLFVYLLQVHINETVSPTTVNLSTSDAARWLVPILCLLVIVVAASVCWWKRLFPWCVPQQVTFVMGEHARWWQKCFGCAKTNTANARMSINMVNNSWYCQQKESRVNI